MSIEKLFKKITEENTEDSVHNEVDNAKGEYVWDWEDRFESLDDAYEEQGRGEAENLVLSNLIKQNDGEVISHDDYNKLFNLLAEYYYLNI